jgi:hypothetical protein
MDPTAFESAGIKQFSVTEKAVVRKNPSNRHGNCTLFEVSIEKATDKDLSQASCLAVRG